MLSRLATQEEDVYDGYRIDVVFETVGEEELREMFATLALKDGLTLPRKAFKRALARYRERTKG